MGDAYDVEGLLATNATHELQSDMLETQDAVNLTLDAQTIMEKADIEDEHDSGVASIDADAEEVDELEDPEMDESVNDQGGEPSAKTLPEDDNEAGKAGKGQETRAVCNNSGSDVSAQTTVSRNTEGERARKCGEISDKTIESNKLLKNAKRDSTDGLVKLAIYNSEAELTEASDTDHDQDDKHNHERDHDSDHDWSTERKSTIASGKEEAPGRDEDVERRDKPDEDRNALENAQHAAQMGEKTAEDERHTDGHSQFNMPENAQDTAQNQIERPEDQQNTGEDMKKPGKEEKTTEDQETCIKREDPDALIIGETWGSDDWEYFNAGVAKEERRKAELKTSKGKEGVESDGKPSGEHGRPKKRSSNQRRRGQTSQDETPNRTGSSKTKSDSNKPNAQSSESTTDKAEQTATEEQHKACADEDDQRNKTQGQRARGTQGADAPQANEVETEHGKQLSKPKSDAQKPKAKSSEKNTGKAEQKGAEVREKACNNEEDQANKTQSQVSQGTQGADAHQANEKEKRPRTRLSKRKSDAKKQNAKGSEKNTVKAKQTAAETEPNASADEVGQGHAVPVNSSTGLFKIPERWGDHRTWPTIPGIDVNIVPQLKTKLRALRKKHLVNGLNWSKQEPEDTKAFMDAVRKTCGEQLGKYEGCWPAEAVTREALTATRRGQGAVETDPEEEDEMAETRKAGKRKTDATSVERSTRVEKRRIVESDEEQTQSQPQRKHKKGKKKSTRKPKSPEIIPTSDEEEGQPGDLIPQPKLATTRRSTRLQSRTHPTTTEAIAEQTPSEPTKILQAKQVPVAADQSVEQGRKRKSNQTDEGLNSKAKRARSSATASSTNVSQGTALSDFLPGEVCEALGRVDIDDLDAFKVMANWDQDLARDALKNDAKLNFIQVGTCLQLLRRIARGEVMA